MPNEILAVDGNDIVQLFASHLVYVDSRETFNTPNSNFNQKVDINSIAMSIADVYDGYTDCWKYIFITPISYLYGD